MQLAKAWLKIHSGGTVPITDLTPPEAVVLNKAHEENANGIAVSGIEITKDVTRSNTEEIKRLRSKYPLLTDRKKNSVVDIVYPGVSPTLPKTFKEALISIPSGAPLEAVEEPEPAKSEPSKK